MFFVKATISLGILALLIYNLQITLLKEAIGRVSVEVWCMAITGFLFGHLLSSMKWRMLLHAVRVKIHGGEALRAHAAGLFANLCLPSVVGGDLVRAGLIIRQTKQTEAVALGSLADRLNDILALTLIAGLAGSMLASVSQGPAEKVLIFFVIALPLATITGISTLYWLRRVNVPMHLLPVLERMQTALDLLMARPGIAILGLTLSILIQLGFVLLNIAIASAMHIPVSAHLWILAWPLAKLIALAPVSLGGIGVREAALAAILAPFGVEPDLAVAQSLCWEAVLISSGLLAGLYTLISRYFVSSRILEDKL